MRIYEINTLPWLLELSSLYGHPVTLAEVPDREWDALTAFQFDAVWLMGVWCRSAAGRSIAQVDASITTSCASLYPGFKASRDIVGSPYCVADYTVDAVLGGRYGLAAARKALARRGMKLILDFVPNHTARDHPWVTAHPEYYVQATPADFDSQPDRYFRTDDGTVVAYGAPSKDPRQAWTDTAQLNAFHPGMRAATLSTLEEIAGQCDGVRCDMAMLLQTEAFAGTWGEAAGARPQREFWKGLIERVRRKHPGLIWIAEAYSETEWPLQQQGFDLCYDKDLLYARLAWGTARSLRAHLQGANLDFQRRLLHFTENHDEPPAEEVFKPQERVWLAAMATATLPGASLWYAGQFEGRWGRAPVQLGGSVSARQFYQRLLSLSNRPAIREGDWALCPVANSDTMVAWCWVKGEDRVLVVLNMSDDVSAWGHLTVPWRDLRGRQWKLRELLRGEEFGPKDGTDMAEGRLYVAPRRWGAELYELTAL